MMLEIGIMTLCVLAACIAITIFFCSIERAPITARNTAKSTKYAGLKDVKKKARIW